MFCCRDNVNNERSEFIFSVVLVSDTILMSYSFSNSLVLMTASLLLWFIGMAALGQDGGESGRR